MNFTANGISIKVDSNGVQILNVSKNMNVQNDSAPADEEYQAEPLIDVNDVQADADRSQAASDEIQGFVDKFQESLDKIQAAADEFQSVADYIHDESDRIIYEAENYDDTYYEDYSYAENEGEAAEGQDPIQVDADQHKTNANLMESAVKRLQTKFNRIMSQLERFEKDMYSEIEKFPK